MPFTSVKILDGIHWNSERFPALDGMGSSSPRQVCWQHALLFYMHLMITWPVGLP